MLIWFLLAIGLVVIVVGGYAGGRRHRGNTQPTKSHRGADAHRHRGRGRH